MSIFDWIVTGVVVVIAIGFGLLYLWAKSMSDAP